MLPEDVLRIPLAASLSYSHDNSNNPPPDRMWISGTTQYAIRAVLYVAEYGGAVPLHVDNISHALGVPRNYLSKTLHSLARAGVLRSERGPRGGFQLAELPERLTLARVAAPFDDLAQRHCLLRQQTCGARTACPAHVRWEAISASLTEFFGKTTIADLMRPDSAARVQAALASRARPGARRKRTTTAATRRK